MTFIVNGVEWKIEFSRPNSDNLRRSDGSITLGVCDNNLKTVFLNNRLSDEMTDKVLCHELVHVYVFENNVEVDLETEEIIADFMSLYGRSIIYLADSLMSSVLKKYA